MKRVREVQKERGRERERKEDKKTAKWVEKNK